MVPTGVSSLSLLGQAQCPRPSYIRVTDCLGKLLGRLRGRLYKHLLISMLTVSHMEVSCDSATVKGLSIRPPDADQCAPPDLHPGNIVFANTRTSYRSDKDVLKSLGKPQMSDVMHSFGVPVTTQVPKYLVLPTSPPFVARALESCQVKLIDFGEAFPVGQLSQIRCPLVFRAPEVVLTSQWDLQVDLWSLGCTVKRLLLTV